MKKSLYLDNYKNLINNILISVQQNIQNIIGQQLLNLIPSITSVSNNSVLTISEDQYLAYNILTSCWGSIYERKKHPYFFLTRPAGTGKTFLTKQIINYLKSNNKRHLLMAPTGVAAQNVGGKTIHSELKITGNIYNLRSLSVYDEYSNQRLKLIKYIN